MQEALWGVHLTGLDLDRVDEFPVGGFNRELEGKDIVLACHALDMSPNRPHPKPVEHRLPSEHVHNKGRPRRTLP